MVFALYSKYFYQNIISKKRLKINYLPNEKWKKVRWPIYLPSVSISEVVKTLNIGTIDLVLCVF